MSTSASSVVEVDNKFGVGKIIGRLQERVTKEIKGRKSSVPNSDIGSTSERSKENTRYLIGLLSWLLLVQNLVATHSPGIENKKPKRGGRRDDDDGETSSRERPEEIIDIEATARVDGIARNVPGIEKEKPRFQRGGRDDDDPEKNKKESLQEMISSAGLPIHAVFAFLIPILCTTVQVKFLGKDRSPFEASPKSMWAFLVATVIYGLGYAANLNYQGTVYSPHIGCVVILAGSFSTAALISVLLPSFGGLVILTIWGIFAIMIARDLAKFICSWIYNWIMVIFRKIYGACHGLLYKQNSMKDVEEVELV